MHLLALLIGLAAVTLAITPSSASAACPPVPEPQTMTNPSFYDFVHTYNGECASKANWDRSFDDVSVAATTRAGDRIEVTTSTALGGAVASLKVNGREYIASGGHGSALQWAFHAWHAGSSPTECYNPTQAGSRMDDAAAGPPWHGPSTSALYVHQRAGAASIVTESRPAMYIPLADPNPGFAGCRAADFQRSGEPFSFGLSPYWLKTTVGLAPENGGAASGNVIRLAAEVTSADDVYANFDGLVVAYLQRRFADAFTLDPPSGSLRARTGDDPGVARPVMRCTRDRSECLGMYFRPEAMPSAYYYTLTNGPTPYNGNSGEYTAQVTVPASSVGAGATSLLRYEVFIAVGDLGRTVDALRRLALRQGPLASPVDAAAPRVGRLRVRPARFRVAKRRARVLFELSETASVQIRVARRKAARTRWVRTIVRREFEPGRVRLRFSGRLRGRALRPGRYRLSLRATDRAGNASPWARTRFRVVKSASDRISRSAGSSGR